MFQKFMEIHYLLPWGNDGRGTKVYLWPFVGVTIILIFASLIDKLI